MKVPNAYTEICRRPYSPVTANDGAAAGNIVVTEARQLPGGIVRVRRTAINGRHRASATEDLSDGQYGEIRE